SVRPGPGSNPQKSDVPPLTRWRSRNAYSYILIVKVLLTFEVVTWQYPAGLTQKLTKCMGII
ncbi:MAG TPA: hypothetical protein VLE44_02380, partial [Candidatus Saccharimonadales bacterium]|nr:hypothetical protein [Candidatus Saccharimonadales bacterium]